MTKEDASVGGRGQGKKRKNRNKSPIYVPPGRQTKVAAEDKSDAGPQGKKVKRVQSTPSPAVPSKAAIATRGAINTRAKTPVIPSPVVAVPAPQPGGASSSAAGKKKKKKRKKAGTSGDDASPSAPSTTNSNLTESPMKVARRLNAAAVGSTPLPATAKSQLKEKPSPSTTGAPPAPSRSDAKTTTVVSSLSASNEVAPIQPTKEAAKAGVPTPPTSPGSVVQSTSAGDPSPSSRPSKASLAKKRKKANRLAAAAAARGLNQATEGEAVKAMTSHTASLCASLNEPPQPTSVKSSTASARAFAKAVKAVASGPPDTEQDKKPATRADPTLPEDSPAASHPHRLDESAKSTAPVQPPKPPSQAVSTSREDAVASADALAVKTTTVLSSPRKAPQEQPKADVSKKEVRAAHTIASVEAASSSSPTSQQLPSNTPALQSPVQVPPAAASTAFAIQATAAPPATDPATEAKLSPKKAKPIGAFTASKAPSSNDQSRAETALPKVPVTPNSPAPAAIPVTIQPSASTPTARNAPVATTPRTEVPPSPTQSSLPCLPARDLALPGLEFPLVRPTEIPTGQVDARQCPTQRPSTTDMVVPVSPVAQPTPLSIRSNERARSEEPASPTQQVSPLTPPTRTVATTPTAPPRSAPQATPRHPVPAPSFPASSPTAQPTPVSSTEPTRRHADARPAPIKNIAPTPLSHPRSFAHASTASATRQAPLASAPLFSEPPRMLPNHVPSSAPAMATWTVTSFGTAPSALPIAPARVACSPLSTWFLSSGQANFIRQSNAASKTKDTRASSTRTPDMSADEKAFYAKLASTHWRSWYTSASVAPDSVVDPPLPHVPSEVQVQVDAVNVMLPTSQAAPEEDSAVATSFDKMMEALAREKAASTSFEQQMIQVLQGKTLTGQPFEEAYRGLLP